MGTSLQVYPFASLVTKVGEHVPRLLFNKEAVGPFANGVKMALEEGSLRKTDSGLKGTYRDVAILGDIDQGVQKFIELFDTTRT